jgi:imidazoleglycerol-phosphate dehydratase/histidinol-phosphatase
MVGDRQTDQLFADNLGIPCFLLDSSRGEAGQKAVDWPDIAHQLVQRPRTAVVDRVTHETRIHVEVDLDRAGRIEIASGIGFLDHMLHQLAAHGGFSLTARCDGDLHIDDHHTTEDLALAIGEALRQALGDKRGIARYGFTLPMDEARATSAIDLSGRPYLSLDCPMDRERVGDLSTEMVPHFWRSFADGLRCTLHLEVTGDNAHHMIEVGFKAVARALRQAKTREGQELPSTKGVL